LCCIRKYRELESTLGKEQKKTNILNNSDVKNIMRKKDAVVFMNPALPFHPVKPFSCIDNNMLKLHILNEMGI
jgi:hypothetical protein